MTDWRLIPLWEGPGSCHMAIDQWLLDRCHGGAHPPTLRFYTWSPVAISLGYHQRQWPSHWQTLTWGDRPVDLVKRPTGGRAVLHGTDLTYSLVLSNQSGHRRETYEYLCGFLRQGLGALGVTLQLGVAGRGYQGQANCFGSVTAADLVGPHGSKLIGSAQVWRGQTVLQQGSIQLNPDWMLLRQVFGATAIPDPLAVSLNIEDTMAALIQAAADYFGVTFVVQPITPLEWDEIQDYIEGTKVQILESRGRL